MRANTFVSTRQILAPMAEKAILLRFTVEQHGQGGDRSHCKIKSNKTGKYVRIHKHQGNFITDCNGGGGKWCVAKVHHGNNDVVKLEFIEAGKYLAVKNGAVTHGAGGPHCRLYFFR